MNQPIPCRRGASAIIVLLMAVPVAIVGFFAISLANIQRHDATSQISTDLASRWGGNAIARMDEKGSLGQGNSDPELGKIEERIKLIARYNWNHGEMQWGQKKKATKHVDVDVQFGSTRFSGGTPDFKKDKKPTNSVRVIASAGAGIAMFGEPIRSVNISSDATMVNVERDICLVLDRSGSMTFDLNSGNWMYDYSRHHMNKMSTHRSSYYRSYSYMWWWGWPHPTNSRWSKMMPAVYGLADELTHTEQNELLSIVSYSSAVTENRWDHNLRYRSFRTTDSGVEYSPTKHYRKAVDVFDYKYKYRFPIMGGTNISAGIDEGVRVLTGNKSRPNAFKTLIVMTDGQYNRGREPWKAAQDAANKGIEVYTVTFSKHASTNTMRKTAEWGKGKHFHAPNGRALEEIFREIANIPPGIYID